MISTVSDIGKAVDNDGYALLAKCGYNTDRVERFEKRLKRLKKQMDRRGHRLIKHMVEDAEKGCVLIWFELYKGGKLVDRSKGVKLVRREGQNE